ncbi:uncharacterized protein LOC131236409 [Magnolia sinica]|uniref:uncharacterized protein LOC131236409 n=1 Tax=Magnolia sinica TaxID=86752 RepID=UPI002657D0D0|nr:uncharacterized protein LOC131236409 [Magnolia sinica]
MASALLFQENNYRVWVFSRCKTSKSDTAEEKNVVRGEQDLSSRNLLEVGEVRDGLYHYRPTPVPALTAILATQSTSPDLWHMRLSHSFASRLSHISFTPHFRYHGHFI